MTHLDGTGDGNLVVNTTAFPTRSPANPGFVHLNMVLGLSTDPVLVGPHHARAELVENLKGRLVARKTKLPLKLHGGHAGRLTGDQISGPEPDVQRECGYAPSLFPPSARCSGGTCGSAGRQGGFQSGTALPPCRSAGRQSRLPSGLSPGRRRRPHHRGKVAGTRVANAGMGDRRGREHPWRAPLYPVCAHSSPSGCGCKPDRQALNMSSISSASARVFVPETVGDHGNGEVARRAQPLIPRPMPVGLGTSQRRGAAGADELAVGD